MAEKNTIVLSLGGSLIVPDEVDITYLGMLKKFVVGWVKRGKRFFIVTGGGKICRTYQQAAKDLGVDNKTTLDEIGIRVTKVNAELVKSVFGNLAYARTVDNYSNMPRTGAKVILAPGWNPGCSTDYDAVYAAQKLGVKRVINLSNIDYLFDKDPNTYLDAKPLKTVTFGDLLKITGTVWRPGANTPFDPKASQLAQKNGIEVVIANGKDLSNLENVIAGKPFVGTTVYSPIKKKN